MRSIPAQLGAQSQSAIEHEFRRGAAAMPVVQLIAAVRQALGRPAQAASVEPGPIRYLEGCNIH